MANLPAAISSLRHFTRQEVVDKLTRLRSSSSLVSTAIRRETAPTQSHSESPTKLARFAPVSPVGAAAAAPMLATPVKAAGDATALQPSLSPGDTGAGGFEPFSS